MQAAKLDILMIFGLFVMIALTINVMADLGSVQSDLQKILTDSNMTSSQFFAAGAK